MERFRRVERHDRGQLRDRHFAGDLPGRRHLQQPPDRDHHRHPERGNLLLHHRRLCYPLNGPLGDGFSYTGHFTVSQSETIRAAFNGMTGPSSEVSATFVINGSQTVAITPDGGSFTTAQSVTIAGIPDGDTCSYTTDGSNPTTSSTAVTYSGAFTVSQSETVQAAIHDPSSGWGGVTAATFTIGGVPSSQAPIITPDGGTFTAPQTVTVTGIPDGDTCYYSTDGTAPRYGSPPSLYRVLHRQPVGDGVCSQAEPGWRLGRRGLGHLHHQ